MTTYARGLVVDYRRAGGARVRALDTVSLQVGSGETVALMGPSGSGKSTLARTIAGLQTPTSGQVMTAMARAPVHRAQRPVALVQQRAEDALFAETVADDIVFAARVLGVPRDHQRELLRHALGAVGLDMSIANRDPLSLSGGEQRRVAIAGALVLAPATLILDEPTAGLDGPARIALEQTLVRLNVSGVGVLLVTHDADEAARLCRRVIVLTKGRVAFEGMAYDVLGDAARARSLGIAVPPAVELASNVLARARARGVVLSPLPRTLDEEVLCAWVADAVPLLAGRAAAPETASPQETRGAMKLGSRGEDLRSSPRAAPHYTSSATLHLVPPRRDARAKLAAFGLAIGALFAAGTIAGVALVVSAIVTVIGLARIEARVVIAAVRPLALLIVTVGVLQAIVGAHPEVAITANNRVNSDLAYVALRALQVVGVTLAAVGLAATTAPVQLAGALAWWLAPLRLVGIPVSDIAFVLATGLAFAPVVGGDVERLRQAQAARGIDPAELGAPLRLQLRATLLAPLIVIAVKRAHALAEAMYVRGYRRGAKRVIWRPRGAGVVDLVVPALSVALLVVAVRV